METIDEKILAKNRLVIREAIEKRLPEDDTNYNTVSALLPGLFRDGNLELDLSVYKPSNPTEPFGTGKYLMYDNPDKAHPFSIWIFAIGYKQKTCIHDHKYRGTVTVLSDAVSEKYYQPIPNTATATRVKRADRFRFHVSQDHLEDTFVHQLKRRKGLGEGISMTLHIYEMEAKIIEQQNTATVTRAKRADKLRFHVSQDHLEDTFAHQRKRRKGLREGISMTLHSYETVIDNRNVDHIYEKATPSSDHSEYLQLRPSFS